MIRTAACLLVLVHCAVAAEPAPLVTVGGERLVVNGHDRVPAGLFGVHNMPLDQRVADWGIEHARFIHQVPGGTPMVPGRHPKVPAAVAPIVECYFDRYIPAKQLTNPAGWAAELRELGRRYGEAARATGHTHYLEFWNEAFLNWANKPGVNYDPVWYDLARAEDGGPVHIRGRDEPVELLRWKQDKWWEVVSGEDDFGKYVQLGNLWHRYSKQQPGESHVHQGRELRAFATLRPYDPGQPSWWSGPQNRIWYSQMLRAFGEGLKQANPEVRLAAGWGFHMSTAGWQAWELLGKPTIDDGIDLIDAWHEHHYGGDPRSAAAQFLAIDSYARRVHGKALRWWNTEAGANYDPQRPDRYKSGDEHWYERRYEDQALRQAHVACGYFLRDVLHAIAVCPDKAVFRADHHPHHNPGSPAAFRLLRPLRGELVATASADPQLWCVASRPTPEALTVVVWNDDREPRPLRLEVTPPGEGRFAACERIALADAVVDGALALVREALVPPPTGPHRLELELPPRQAVVLRYDLAGVGAVPQLRVDEYLADTELRDLAPGQTVACRVAFPAGALAAASGARLRVVRAGEGLDQGRVRIGEHELALPSGSFTQYLELDPGWLSEDTALIFSTEGPSHQLYAAAIELVTRE